jgi:hypothetical protein
MPKITYFTMLSVIVLAAVTAINLHAVNASEEAKFVQVSVLAHDQADYGVDENTRLIPAISPEIIEDKVEDLQSVSETVKTIKYTTLPVQNSEATGEDNNSSQNTNNSQNKKDHDNNGNGSGNQNQNTNGNGAANQNNGQGSNASNGNLPPASNKDKGGASDKGAPTKPGKTK